jgi:hypothetical protein
MTSQLKMFWQVIAPLALPQGAEPRDRDVSMTPGSMKRIIRWSPRRSQKERRGKVPDGLPDRDMRLEPGSAMRGGRQERLNDPAPDEDKAPPPLGHSVIGRVHQIPHPTVSHGSKSIQQSREAMGPAAVRQPRYVLKGDVTRPQRSDQA